MKKATDSRVIRMEDIIKLIDDHLVELHRLAEDALVAETTAEHEPDISMLLPDPSQRPDGK